ncbi:MAG: hypothetical protein FWC27_04215 [Firmicutes bacterium]|nr:hypothetical protein [Bacillota bacterium]
MKRIFALALGLLFLASCGAGGTDKPAGPRLIAEWPENDITLYMVEEGTVLLRHGTEEATFSGWGKPWIGLDYQIGMGYYDIDGDGLNELAVSTQVEHGETWSENLHIITLEKQPWEDHVFTTGDVAAWFGKRLQYRRGETENTAEVTLGNKTWKVRLSKPELNLADPAIDHCMYPLLGGEIVLRAGSFAIDGDFPAKVTFDGEQFDIVDAYYLPAVYSGGG